MTVPEPIEKGLQNPFWQEVSRRRQDVRALVVGEYKGSARDRPEFLAIIEDLLEKLKPALADELDAFTWGDGEEYHLDEAHAMEVLQERLENRRREYIDRQAQRE